MANEQGYNGGELAAVLATFFRNANRTNEMYGSFEEQLKESAAVGTGGDFERAMKAFQALYRQKPYLIDAVHQTVRAALTELESLRDESGAKLWSSCKLVSVKHIKMLCNEGQP
jgi:hypothetical protein